jgi:phosphoribosylcarboxyaminoimidazole (NCAIR) mutase
MIMPSLSTATITSAAVAQLRNFQRGDVQRVKRNMAIIAAHGGPEAVALLAETWAQILIASRGWARVEDSNADPEILSAAQEFLTTINTDRDAALSLITTHPEPLYVASVLLAAAARKENRS